jgi:myosin heavy chain 9/10/11/14
MTTVTRDLEASDGSRASLETAREKLRQRNREMAALLQRQQKQQQSADAQNIASIQDIWKSFKAHMQDERSRYSALDSNKRDLLASHKIKTIEVEDLTARLKDANVRVKRLQSQPNQERSKTPRVERQWPTDLSDTVDPTILELENELMSQKTLSETHLARAESAEVAKQRAEREASILRSDLQRLSKQIEETVAARDKKAEQCAGLDKRIRAMEAHAEDRELLNNEVINAEVQKLLEKERGRYHKDLQDRDFTIGQTRAKYQGELAQLSEEQGQLRDELSRAKEESRVHKANAEALKLKLDEDSHELSSWKLSRDRDESRIRE